MRASKPEVTGCGWHAESHLPGPRAVLTATNMGNCSRVSLSFSACACASALQSSSLRHKSDHQEVQQTWNSHLTDRQRPCYVADGACLQSNQSENSFLGRACMHFRFWWEWAPARTRSLPGSRPQMAPFIRGHMDGSLSIRGQNKNVPPPCLLCVWDTRDHTHQVRGPQTMTPGAASSSPSTFYK